MAPRSQLIPTFSYLFLPALNWAVRHIPYFIVVVSENHVYFPEVS